MAPSPRQNPPCPHSSPHRTEPCIARSPEAPEDHDAEHCPIEGRPPRKNIPETPPSHPPVSHHTNALRRIQFAPARKTIPSAIPLSARVSPMDYGNDPLYTSHINQLSPTSLSVHPVPATGSTPLL